MKSLLTAAATGQKILNGPAVALHDELVCCADAASWAAVCDSQDQRIIQAARPLQYGAAAGATAQHANSARRARSRVHLRGHFVRVADDDKIFMRLPETENFLTRARLAPVEQCFVARQILGRSRQSQVKASHAGERTESVATSRLARQADNQWSVA